MNLKVLSFGVSKYIYLRPTHYADNDANGFCNAFQELHSPSLCSVNLDEQLTKTIFIKRFKEFCNDLTENSSLYFFYAGHGCSFKEKAYLSCYDSMIDDIETWIDVDDLMNLASSKSKKIIFFIDSCQDETPDNGSRGELLDQLDFRESYKIQDENHYRIILFSSSKGEKANVRDSKKHGIWSYFLIQALRGEGEGKEALSPQYHLYLNKLQEYLHIRVKEFYRGIGKAPKQSTRIKGEWHIDPLIAIFSPPHVEKYEAVPTEVIPHISFETIITKSVNRLDGFDKKKGHKTPKFLNQKARNWVKEIGDFDIQSIMDKDCEKIVQLFDLDPNESIENGGFKIEPANESGVCSFECKYFNYTISLELDENDLKYVIILFDLRPFDQDKLYQTRDQLDSCFTHWFDSMVLEKGEIDVKGLFSKLKKASETKKLPFSFKFKPSSDEIEILFEDGRTFRISHDSVRVDFKASETVDVMLGSLAEISNEILLIDSSTKLLG